MARGPLEPRPRLVDWSLLAAVALVVGTGLLGLVTALPGDAWVFVVHGAAGLVLVALLFWKLRRVADRLTDRRRWDRVTPVSIALAVLAVAALLTGVLWVAGAEFGVWRWTGLMVHMVLGVLVVPALLAHFALRYEPPTREDVEGRRTALQYAVLAAGGLLAWRVQQAAVRALDTVGAARRFTGSRPEPGEGNDYPVTMWVADDPDRIDPAAWSLAVDGAVDRSRAFEYPALTAGADDAPSDPGRDSRRALLDCTSGWYAERSWQGVRVGALLDRAAPADRARYVSFHSVTGYRWSLPIDEARDALLATHVDEEPLTHGHGFPLRLVAPGRRGFQWVKWVERVEVRETPDYGQWVAIFTSGFD